MEHFLLELARDIAARINDHIGFKVKYRREIPVDFHSQTLQDWNMLKAKNKERGIIILASLEIGCPDPPTFAPHLKIITKARFNTGGYRYMPIMTIKKAEDIDELLDTIKTSDPGTLGRDMLPHPHQFTIPEFSFINGDTYRNTQISKARVIACVTINGLGRITTAGIQDPCETPYFYIHCGNHRGSTFDMVCNGTDFYPVRKIHTLQLNGNTPIDTIIIRKYQQLSITIDQFSISDRSLIREAIGQWVAGMSAS